MDVGSEVMEAFNLLEQVARLTHEVPPAALPRGACTRWPETATRTGPVYTRSGCLCAVCVVCMCVCGSMRNSLLTQAISKKVKV